MKHYAIIDAAGNILRGVSCLEEILVYQLQTGERALEVSRDTKLLGKRVVDDQLEDIPDWDPGPQIHITFS